MRVEYRSTADDYKHLLQVTAPLQKLTWTTRISYGLAIVLLIAFGRLVDNTVVLTVTGSVLAVFLIFFLPRSMQGNYVRKINEMARKARPDPAGTAFSIELAEHAMIANDGGIRVECPWHKVERVEVDEDAILLHLVPMGAIQVMRHACRDEQHLQEFIDRARMLIARHEPTHPPLAS